MQNSTIEIDDDNKSKRFVFLRHIHNTPYTYDSFGVQSQIVVLTKYDYFFVANI